jgi:hypothetical protein
MKRTGVFFLFALLLIAGVVEGQSGNSALSGAYHVYSRPIGDGNRDPQINRNFSITFIGNNFTGSWGGVSILGTFSVSSSRLTLNITSGATRANGIPSRMTWTIVDANTLRDQDGDIWNKEGSMAHERREQERREQERQAQAQAQVQQAQEQRQREEYESIPSEPESSFRIDLTRDGSGIIITGYTGTTREVRIPAIIQGFPVKEINGAFTRNTTITSVVIPPGITSIKDREFQGCANLTSVVISESVTSIGGSAFQGCAKLASVVIPESVTSIGDSAFGDCASLASVSRFPKNIGASAFQGCSSLTGEISLMDNVIGSNAFAGTGISAVRLYLFGDLEENWRGRSKPTSFPSNIGNGAFARCLNLREVTIEGERNNRAYSVGNLSFAIGNFVSEGLFSGCTALTTINLSRISGVNARAFSGCTALTSITLPGTFTINADAFSGCTSLAAITIPASAEFSFPGNNAFSGCSSLPLVTQARLRQLGYRDGF